MLSTSYLYRDELQMPAIKMASAFSTNSEDAFTKTLDIGHEMRIKDEEIEKYFEIKRCVEFIENGSFERVALQFPDELLNNSFKVFKLIQESCPSTKLYILGDTTYGSCCVDEIAAEHISADCIIHFGRACLTKTRRLPVLFVFGRGFIDVEDFCQQFKATFEDKATRVILFHDVIYDHVISEIEDELKKHYSNIVFSELLTDVWNRCSECHKKQNRYVERHCAAQICCKNTGEALSCTSDDNNPEQCSCDGHPSVQDGGTHQRFGRTFKYPLDTKIEEYIILYIGEEGLTLTNLMMTYNHNKFFRYNPDEKVFKHESSNMNKALMKRYYLIQMAKAAKTVGIVVGTLGVADYLLIIEHLKRLLKQSGKKHYTFMMGKPNVAKMANFLEIDIFVLVACPENSLISSQEFYKPIITPFELEIACSREREWTGEYITDFKEILPDVGSSAKTEKDSIKIDNEEPEYSLISGSLIQNINMNETDKKENISSDLVPRNQENALVNFGEHSSAYFLQTRCWTGLEQKLGETKVEDAVEGRTGIAIGYTHEFNENHSNSVG